MFSLDKSLNFADICLSIPLESLESSLKNQPEVVNVKGYGGQTALHKAVLIGNLSVALLLLKHGADPNIPTDTGETSLHIACSRGALKILQTLLKFGGDLKIPNRNGNLPLHCASQNGSIVVIQFLSEVYGCSLESYDANGATVLHGACAGGHLDLVRFLLERKRLFCLNADSEGNTILHSGALGGVSGVCWCIVSHGGESLLNAKNKSGHKPLQIAENALNVSQDCKKWMKIWTEEYSRRNKVSSPKFTWLLLLCTPFFIFHATIILSVLSMPEKQWTIGIPGFIILLCIMRKQQHRISHPVRWSNPIYLGAYVAGFASSFLRYCCLLTERFSQFPVLHGATIALFTIQFYFLFFLLRKDPGKIPPNEYAKDSLIRMAEDRLEGRYCPYCFLSAPIASHHCRLCERCLLQLDHHCLFLNVCIAANNHWHFVVFLLLNFCSMSSFVVSSCLNVPVSKLEGFADWIYSSLAFWLCHDMWNFMLLICHILSLLWAFSLIKYQFQVIGTEQTSYCRIKGDTPRMKYTTLRKASNFLNFLYNRQFALRNSSHYIQA